MFASVPRSHLDQRNISHRFVSDGSHIPLISSSHLSCDSDIPLFTHHQPNYPPIPFSHRMSIQSFPTDFPERHCLTIRNDVTTEISPPIVSSFSFRLARDVVISLIFASALSEDGFQLLTLPLISELLCCLGPATSRMKRLPALSIFHTASLHWNNNVVTYFDGVTQEIS